MRWKLRVPIWAARLAPMPRACGKHPSMSPLRGVSAPILALNSHDPGTLLRAKKIPSAISNKTHFDEKVSKKAQKKRLLRSSQHSFRQIASSSKRTFSLHGSLASGKGSNVYASAALFRTRARHAPVPFSVAGIISVRRAWREASTALRCRARLAATVPGGLSGETLSPRAMAP
jgi:hypothetical protein